MTLLATLAALGLLAVFFSDFVLPDYRTPPLPPRPPKPLAQLLSEIPARNNGRFGRAGDPLNLLFIGSEEQVCAALSEAGWSAIPVRWPASFRAGFRDLLDGGKLKRCPPMNLYRVEGRVQDFNWAVPVTQITERHHFRLWRSSWRDERDRPVWWGSGNYDVDMRWHELSHIPHPDMNMERDFIHESLKGSPWVESARLQPLPQIPSDGVNDKGHPFRTDGRALVVTLKNA